MMSIDAQLLAVDGVSVLVKGVRVSRKRVEVLANEELSMAVAEDAE